MIMSRNQHYVVTSIVVESDSVFLRKLLFNLPVLSTIFLLKVDPFSRSLKAWGRQSSIMMPL